MCIRDSDEVLRLKQISGLADLFANKNFSIPDKKEELSLIHISADEEVRRRIDRAININEVCDVNTFGVIATMAAYNEGGELSLIHI